MNTEIASISKNEYKDLIKRVVQDLQNLDKLTNKQKIEKNNDIKEMIKHYLNMSNNLDNRRNMLLGTTWNILTVLFLLATFIITIKTSLGADYIFLLIPIISVVSVLSIFSVAKIYEYHRQSGYRYPFLDIKEFSNKWKWFYYGNEPITKIDPNPGINKLNLNYVKNNEYFLLGLSNFIDNYTKETLKTELRENIIQLYLLQVHNFYKNKFLLRLNSIDLASYKWTTIMLIIAIIIDLILYI
jgi:hypothetical protein